MARSLPIAGPELRTALEIIQVKPTVEENDRYGESYDGFGI
jgi:hypothetical protein